MTDLDLDAPVAMSRREVLKEALGHLDAATDCALDVGISSDDAVEHISAAARLVKLALKETTAEQLARFGVAK